MDAIEANIMTGPRPGVRALALAAAVLALVSLGACGVRFGSRPGDVDEKRLIAEDGRSGAWLANGAGWRGDYYSALTDINPKTAQKVGFAWQYDLRTTRGQEATPIVVDGVMYVSTNWGRAVAVDAATGREIWSYDPGVDGQWGRYACCDVVNRGLAVWKGVVYVGSTDNYLHAIDARTGKRLWKADVIDPAERSAHVPYTVSGAPQVAGDVVVIGTGGADFGVRGFVRAFDLKTGARRWTFWTVPRDPRLGPQEAPHLKTALATWDPQSDWSQGGGGTVWDGMAYDPKLDLLYIGTGNSSPYDYQARSKGKGDNLYLASILAIDPKDGALRWHFQTVPGERWDYTATQKLILADLKVKGETRQVLMQAPKNGFFYVLDRKTGELISADPYVYQNWSKGIDPASGKHIVDLEKSDYTKGPRLIYPSPAGGHNWQPMSFNPSTGLVYIPVIDMPMIFYDLSGAPDAQGQGAFSLGTLPPEAYDPLSLKAFGHFPAIEQLARVAGGPAKPASRGFIRAWDPVKRKIVWEAPTESFWDGGVLSTKGGLVVSGDIAGRLNFRRADTGALVKTIETGTSIMAAPMTYEVKGEQYIAVLGGLGGGGGAQFPPNSAAYRNGNAGRIMVFKLGGGPTPIPPARAAETWMEPPRPPAFSAADASAGERIFGKYCARCHGFGRGLAPDLRRISNDTHAALPDIVLGGAYRANGMGSFADLITKDDLTKIHAFLSREQLKLYANETAARGAIARSSIQGPPAPPVAP